MVCGRVEFQILRDLVGRTSLSAPCQGREPERPGKECGARQVGAESQAERSWRRGEPVGALARARIAVLDQQLERSIGVAIQSGGTVANGEAVKRVGGKKSRPSGAISYIDSDQKPSTGTSRGKFSR